MIDPRRLNTQAPLVAIERVTLDREALPAGQTVQISPGQENLEIQYTALSWSRPQQIRFRYKLVGLDESWVEAGTRRTAYFPHLPPGAYTFTVIADNGEGVWNNEGRSLRIVALPPFYRTWWFVALAGLGAAGLAVFAYRYRVQHRIRQFQRAQEAQQAFARQLIASQENERKRIAAELHDSLGQHLLIIKNRAVIGERLAAEHGPLREQLDEINASATQAISEARAIAYNLRPLHLDRLGLTAVLEEMIEKVARASGIEFSADIEPLDGVFTPEGEINFYRIIQESINNIVKHARATRAAVEIWREDGDLHVTVRDDGRGFDAGALSDSTVKAPVRGFGLTGISERVRMLGGAQTIISTPGQGATLTIRIPLQDSAGGAEHAT